MAIPEGWNIAKSMSSLKACNMPQRSEDDEGNFSADITTPTIQGGTCDLASGINKHHAEQVAREDHFREDG